MTDLLRLLAADLKQAIDAVLPSTDIQEVTDMPGTNYPGKENIKRETGPAPHPARPDGKPGTHSPERTGLPATGKPQTTPTEPGPNG